jgi:hypothetical protein
MMIMTFPTPVAAPIQLALAPIAGAMARIIIPILASSRIINVSGSY